MSDETWIMWGVPAVVLLIGGISLMIAWLGARSFDREYGSGPR